MTSIQLFGREPAGQTRLVLNYLSNHIADFLAQQTPNLATTVSLTFVTLAHRKTTSFQSIKNSPVEPSLESIHASTEQDSNLHFQINMDLPNNDRSIILRNASYRSVLNSIHQKIQDKLRRLSLDGELTYTLTSEHPKPGRIYFTLKVWCSVYHDTFSSLLDDVDGELYHKLQELPHMLYIIPEV